MSSAYATEPPTKGKVIIHTSSGDLEIELWPKETPKACRNFVQLCMEGYYDGTIIHRVVKDFIVQGGDPTGTGNGGESIYGSPFPDEFHSRLRFSHRGLLAMANTGPNTNQTQFFFTLDKTEELNKKNTIFGKVVGDTIYNLLKIGESEVNDDERPIYDVVIRSTSILSNPFDDIIPRTTAAEKAAKLAAERLEAQRRTEIKKPKVKKNLKLLSFGEEEEVQADASPGFKKVTSSHDALTDDPRLRPQSAISSDELKAPQLSDARTEHSVATPARANQLKSSNRRPGSSDGHSSASDYDSEGESEAVRHRPKRPKTESSVGSPVAFGSKAKMMSLQSELTQLTKEIRGIGSSKESSEGLSKGSSKKGSSFVDAFRSQYGGTSSLRRKGNEGDVLKTLEAFRLKLRNSDAPASSPRNENGRQDECRLHGLRNCKSCYSADDDEGDDVGWMAHQLKFAREAANVYEPKVDDYAVFDPRAELQSGDAQRKPRAKEPQRSSRDTEKPPRNSRV
ncbi:peptidyl-prolyl cis-trans isomerase CWC27 [Polychytrium aggregatum]|uniref:peptidyl-prolyl cis-trans isomerase CWC27 n=1 Tax=Polychytrium aggregatum TaxID=110093 RepID=UPI0022FDC243|nr:peptidyl-prolyl cis-trans isomerase CWC27 [Polychytrium aggregatum]KAI9190575.1 peptidyl-prolyl cis-trans isomerase CWC27 [Polychytrium aggregatum]